ncbi:MAG TPA: division/cell wall cluster transcriptional repressor MraZ [Bacteroidales bacterium]|nr:division/cell wall cluster transcriptional repressor MraZ [Bacteroidales bacterium]HCI54909.1 cell division protein MraZ [Bacteroidales bacterium]HOU96593.1 division/cell wall cluster transcriptional repressor MraZ [Bacteroidales bacterium]HQG36781.1 division/cell wall cluster transcriptional repressor MraZ [Bacteroidales bacterium]HQG53500.1 division/cell wall cluster transcriptional repressor MraZ [Bacteroidales bacterium]
MATFIGDYGCRLDSKGRFILPAAFKKQMPQGSPDRFVVRRDIFEPCLVLYTIDDWNLQLERIRSRINPYNREHNLFLRSFFKGTAEIIMDSNNRLLIPKRLLDLAGITREVILAGQDGRIEIWDAARYEKIEIQPDEFAALAEKLLGNGLNQE